jgi:RNA polymerase sigma factor for flagellar operon FliA
MNNLAMYDSDQKTTREKNEMVEKYAGLVKRIAYHIMSRLPPSVQVDDLIQSGMIGLLEASKNYDAGQGASFETYAGIRIRGAMLDEIRKGDWAPRSVHRKARQVAEAVRNIENVSGRDARDHEVAKELNMSIEEYHKTLQDASGCRLLSFEEMGATDDHLSSKAIDQLGPYDGVQKEDFKKSLAHEISGLPERERMVLTLYYEEDLNLREIGAVIGVSESRVSQIHSQALIRLQARLGHWLNDD